MFIYGKKAYNINNNNNNKIIKLHIYLATTTLHKIYREQRSMLYYGYYSLLFVDQKLFLFQTITSADKLSFLSRKIFIQKVCAEALHGCRVEQSYGA